MKDLRIQQHIIKVIGLLGDSSDVEQIIRKGQYKEDKGPDRNSTYENQIREYAFYRDNFYPDFRNIMFLESKQVNGSRFSKKCTHQIQFERNQRLFGINITEVSIFLFEGHIGLFSISFSLPENCNTIGYLSDISLLIKNFDSSLENQGKWHEWISKHLLEGIPLRGLKVKADEYSGSKLKLYTVIDLEEDIDTRESILFDVATTSPIGSGLGEGIWAPSKTYYQKIMADKIAPFNNWEALCLFDSFTCVGKGQLQGYNSITWDRTYFRIYLFQLFFKYNLYRYNSDLHEAPVKLRDDFEHFLSQFKMSHISFNFLSNELFDKIGKSLDINHELAEFEQRINKLSTKIQEEKQSKTNKLLQLVSVLTAISSAEPVIDFIQKTEAKLGWTHVAFYGLLSSIVLLLAGGLTYYLYPETIKKWFKF